jgi:hypothetical protein
MNSRKGFCAAGDDLLDESADVIITAAVAMTGIAGDAETASARPSRLLPVDHGCGGSP